MNPLFRLITSRPNLVAAHAESYLQLLAEEINAGSRALSRRVFLGCAAWLLMLLFLLLAGIGLMLWGALPEVRSEQSWILIAVPSAPLLTSFLLFLIIKADPPPAGLTKVKAQMRADLAMLRETGAL